jgi:hypothetical protein
MVAQVATPFTEIIKRRDSISASWTFAERNFRAHIANAMQHELMDLMLAGEMGCGGDRIDRDTTRWETSTFKSF